MLLTELPSKKQEKVFFKIQVFDFCSWKEQPKIYNTIETATASASKISKCRIVKRSDKGWELVKEFTPKRSNKKLDKTIRDHLADKEGISREWMKKHLVIMGGV